MANIVHDGSPEKGSYKVSHPLSLTLQEIYKDFNSDFVSLLLFFVFQDNHVSGIPVPVHIDLFL
jgi:hypothetical protein